MIIRPITTEKIIRNLEIENTLVFEVAKKDSKDEIKKEFEEMFKVKIEKIRTNIKANHKFAHIKLDKKNPAIDIATKLGMM